MDSYYQMMVDRLNELELELAEAKKKLIDYKAVTKIVLDKLQSQLQKENEDGS